jgi:hypothetical protein
MHIVNIVYETAKISLHILNNGNVPHSLKEIFGTLNIYLTPVEQDYIV